MSYNYSSDKMAANWMPNLVELERQMRSEFFEDTGQPDPIVTHLREFVSKIGSQQGPSKEPSMATDVQPQQSNLPRDNELQELEHLMNQHFFGGNAKAAASNPFSYSAIRGSGTIRVLRLQPGNKSAPLKASLVHAQVTTALYEALSYVWGSESKPCDIMVDDRMMPITRALFNALMRVRSTTEVKPLWADGICINQQDDNEKAVQVAMMSEIYLSATRVQVYLGEQADGSEYIPRLMEIMDRSPNNDLWTLLCPLNIPPETDLAQGWHERWEIVQKFLLRPWFLRAWIIQEAALARHIHFICGEWERPCNKIGDAVTKLSTCLALPQSVKGTLSEDFVAGVNNLASILHIRSVRFLRSQRMIAWDNYRKIKESASADPDNPRWKALLLWNQMMLPSLEKGGSQVLDTSASCDTHITALLRLFCTCRAGNTRDRVYAFLGLAEDVTATDLPPSYTESVDKLWNRFNILLVKKRQGMEALYAGRRLTSDTEHDSLPSWMPDWTCPSPALCVRYAGILELKDRLSQRNHVFLAEEGSNLLRASGFRLDSCAQFVSTVISHPNIAHAHFERGNLMERFLSEIDELMCGKPYLTGEPWDEVRWRTLIANKTTSPDDSATMLGEHYRQLRQHFTSSPTSAFADVQTNHQIRTENRWYRGARDVMFENKPCRTEGGYVGLVPKSAIASDEIFMLKGAVLPFVLRRSAASPDRHQLVGVCYVHGFEGGNFSTSSGDTRDIFIE